jgi:hypothetical protein
MYRYGFVYGGVVKWFYAANEEEARKQYALIYGIDAGDLIERKPW